MRTVACSIDDTEACAADFLWRISEEAVGREREHATVVGLSGELGAGKTAFVKAAAKALGVSETVTSPTFVIEKIYKLQTTISNLPFTHLIHIDAYRLETADELLRLGWNDILGDPNNLIMLEWPENVSGILPEDTVHIEFEISRENKRVLKVKMKNEKQQCKI